MEPAYRRHDLSDKDWNVLAIMVPENGTVC